MPRNSARFAAELPRREVPNLGVNGGAHAVGGHHSDLKVFGPFPSGLALLRTAAGLVEPVVVRYEVGTFFGNMVLKLG